MTSTERFSDRVEAYVKYRPSYSAEVVGALWRACGLTPAAVIADRRLGHGQAERTLFAKRQPRLRRRAQRRHAGGGGEAARALPHLHERTGHGGGDDAGGRECGLRGPRARHFTGSTSQKTRGGVRAHPQALRLGRAGLEFAPAGGYAPFWRVYEEALRRFAPDYAGGQSSGQRRAGGHQGFFRARARCRGSRWRTRRRSIMRGLKDAPSPPLTCLWAGEPQHEAFLEALRELFERARAGRRGELFVHHRNLLRATMTPADAPKFARLLRDQTGVPGGCALRARHARFQGWRQDVRALWHYGNHPRW